MRYEFKFQNTQIMKIMKKMVTRGLQHDASVSSDIDFIGRLEMIQSDVYSHAVVKLSAI